jgi:hypothetical protein
VTSKSRKLLYGLLAFVVFALAINTPGIIQGRTQKKAADMAFSSYSKALLVGDYAGAYQLCGDGFRRSTSFESFVEEQRESTSSLGRLETIENKGTFVHGRGSPMQWTAVIEARELHEKGDIHLACELHLENGGWKLFGCKQV